MSTNEQAPARGRLATTVATASITLALGVTAAALTGYLRAPDRPAEAAPASAQTAEASAAPSPALNTSPNAAPTVVLVPVTREPRAAAVAPTGDALFASYQADEHGEDHDRSARGHPRDEGRDDEDSDSDD